MLLQIAVSLLQGGGNISMILAYSGPSLIHLIADSQKALNVPRILKWTLIMFLIIKLQKSYLNGLNLWK